jgi:hypothetical protein
MRYRLQPNPVLYDVQYRTEYRLSAADVGAEHQSDENVIGPAIEGYKPPVVASFRSSITGILGVMANVSSVFAGGDAGATLTEYLYDTNSRQVYDSTGCVTKQAEAKFFDYDVSPYGPGRASPFIFGTDTSFGLKVRWSGATAQYPDSVKLGYNRKEWAFAPVATRPASSVSGTITGTETAGSVQLVKFADDWMYRVTPNTIVLRGGQPVAFAGLKAGDAVDMYGTYMVVKQGSVYVPAPVSPGRRNAPCSWGEWEVRMPSFLAVVDHDTKLGTPTDSSDKHVQWFATGAAASSLATQDSIKAVMANRIDPKAAVAAQQARAQTARQNFSKQKASLDEIQKLFAAMDDSTQKKVVAKAKNLGLVKAETDEASFPGNLSDAVNGDPKNTEPLETLREFAKNPQ